MNKVTALRILAVGVLLIGISTPITFHLAPNETLAHAIAVVGWLCFVALPFLFPAIVLLSGKITTKTSISYRAVEPIRFWVGLVTFEVLFLFIAYFATLVFHAHLIDRGA